MKATKQLLVYHWGILASKPKYLILQVLTISFYKDVANLQIRVRDASFLSNPLPLMLLEIVVL
jgi:hypothetical protein